MKYLIVFIGLMGLLQVGCYNSYTISKEELGKLQSGKEQADLKIESVTGEQFDISAETPLEVKVQGGEGYRITPYNFLLSESQLVSPDYDLLLNASTVEGAEVRQISYGKTFGLIGGVVAVVAGGFVVLAVGN